MIMSGTIGTSEAVLQRNKTPRCAMTRRKIGGIWAGRGLRQAVVHAWLSVCALLSATLAGSLALPLSASMLAAVVLSAPASAQGTQPDDEKKFDAAIDEAYAAWKGKEWAKAKDAYERASRVSVDWFRLYRIQLAYVHLQLGEKTPGLKQLEAFELAEQSRGNLKWAEAEAANPGDDSKPLKYADVKRQLDEMNEGDKTPPPAQPKAKPPAPAPTPAPEPTSEAVRAKARADELVGSARSMDQPAQIESALARVAEAIKSDPDHAGAKALKQELDRRKIERDARVETLLDLARTEGESRETKDAALQKVSRALEFNPRSQEALELRKSIESRYTGATYKPGQTQKVELKDNEIVIETAWIPAGMFTMGSPESEASRSADEGPQHRVGIGGGPRADKGFWMMTTEVQQGQWQAVMGSNPSSFKSGPTYPVESVSWYEAVEFANKLTEAVAKKNPGMNLRPYYTIDVRKRGDDGRVEEAEVRPNPGNRGYRLPTEAEWEYACRAGTTSPFHFGQTISTDVANYDGNSVYGAGVKGEYRRRTTPTAFFGERGKNQWGLYDMHGNVWEWCWDGYDTEWYKPEKMAVERVNPIGPQTGSNRVLRGGSWYSAPWLLRSADRYWNGPTNRVSGIGFRLLLDSE